MQRGSTTPGGEPSVIINALFTLQGDIGRLMEGQRGMLAAMERMRIELHQRADRLEQRPCPGPRPIPLPPTTSLADFTALLAQVVSLVKVLVPLALVAAIVFYKLENPDWLPLLRKLVASL